MQVYYDKDADLKYIQNRKIAVIGFGSQGHAQAMNLADSGCDVVVGLKSTSASVPKAQKAGLRVLSVRDAAAQSEIVMILVPDTTQADLYRDQIAPNLILVMQFSHIRLDFLCHSVKARSQSSKFILAFRRNNALSVVTTLHLLSSKRERC